MGHALSLSLIPFHQSLDSKTGFKLNKVLNTQRSEAVASLRIQPAGTLLATGDESGNLLIFDLVTEAVRPQQIYQLHSEQGGISEMCWVTDDIIAVGTTRGKIIVFANRNKTERFHYICNVEAHGDGVAEIAVESMTFSPHQRCLASVGEGKIGVKLWNIDPDGVLSPRATGAQALEYAVPRFVGFSENGAEIVVGYLEQALVKRFAIHPWKSLTRTNLGGQNEAQTAVHCIGSAALLPRTRELAVFNQRDGLDLYNFPDLSNKREARYRINPHTSQGIAVLRSGALLASPSATGDVMIFNSHDASLITALRCSSTRKSPFYAVDGMTNRDKDVLVAACRTEEETCIVVWRNMNESRHNSTPIPAEFQTRVVILVILAYALCSAIQPLFVGLASLTAMNFVSVTQNQWTNTIIQCKPLAYFREVNKIHPTTETEIFRSRPEPPDVDAGRQELATKTGKFDATTVVTVETAALETTALEVEVEGSAVTHAAPEEDRVAHTIITGTVIGGAE